MRWHVTAAVFLAWGCERQGAPRTVSADDEAVCAHVREVCDMFRPEPGTDPACAGYDRQRRDMGDYFDTFLACARKASSCGDYIGCGLAWSKTDRAKEIQAARDAEVEKAPMPPLCTRAAALCADDPGEVEDTENDCKTSVVTYEGTAAVLAMNIACMEAATSCTALSTCADHLGQGVAARLTR